MADPSDLCLVSIPNTLQQDISHLLNLVQTYAVPDEDESLFMKNTCNIFKQIVSLPTNLYDQKILRQLQEAYHTIKTLTSELEDANASVSYWR
jgi:hypothetical protein